jgi:hypothetical protein
MSQNLDGWMLCGGIRLWMRAFHYIRLAGFNRVSHERVSEEGQKSLKNPILAIFSGRLAG